MLVGEEKTVALYVNKTRLNAGHDYITLKMNKFSDCLEFERDKIKLVPTKKNEDVRVKVSALTGSSRCRTEAPAESSIARETRFICPPERFSSPTGPMTSPARSSKSSFFISQSILLDLSSGVVDAGRRVDA